MKHISNALIIGHKRNKLATYFVAAFFLTLLSTPLLALTLTTSAYADTEYPSANKSLDINVYIDPVISIRALDSTGTNPISALPVNVTPTSTGTFAKNNLILQVDSTNSTGYSLYLTSDYKTDGTTSETTPATAASYTNSLVNLTYNDTITSLASTITPENPVSETDFSTTSSTYQNMWGISTAWNETFSGTTFSGGSATDYFSVPVNGTTTTIRDDVDTVSNNSRTSVGVGVNVNTNKEAGIYRNRLVFTSVANPLPVDYTLTFDKNTSDTVTNLPAPMTDTVIAQSKTFTIPNTTPTRDGYQFIGWSRSATERQGTGSGPDGLYVAGDSFTVLSDDQTSSGTTTRFTGTATAYAFWAQEYTYALNYSCGEGATDCPSTQTATSTDTSYTFTISSTTPELEGYDFVNYTDNGAGAGNEYDPGDTITLTNSASTKTLTANWEEKPKCNVSANQICYAPNADDVVGEMPNQTTVYLNSTSNAIDSTALSGSTTELTLYSPNYSRAGYGFAGWTLNADGSGTVYGPNQTLTTTDSTLTSAMQSELGSNGLILYAKWVPSAGDIASWSGCSSLAKGSVTALTDSRESGNPQTYAVAKLVDDKCWIIENMRYQGGGTSSNSWGTSTSASYFNYTNMNRSLTAAPTEHNDGTGAQWYSYGAYYSWPARTSVCPSGWSVPTANGSSTDFGYLYSLVGNASSFATSNNLRKYPNNFVFAGYWYRSSAYSRGRYADYWSATQNDSSYAYNLYFGPTDVNPAGYNDKYFGFSIRCVRSS